MERKILYIDMDGVTCDFMSGVYEKFPYIEEMDSKNRESVIDYFLEENPRYFLKLPPIPGAIEAITILNNHYDIYFLTTPARNCEHSYMDKKIWLEQYIFQPLEMSNKNLILTHRKDLQIGDYLIDDRLVNGSESFTGKFLHFGEGKEFSTWKDILKYFSDINFDIKY